MRISAVFFAVISTTVAATLLSACGGTPPTGSVGMSPGTNGNRIGPPHGTHRVHRADTTRVVYFSGGFSSSTYGVEVRKYRTWALLNDIQIPDAEGLWVDGAGNLYVASPGELGVLEYDSSLNQIFIYDQGGRPTAVTTDPLGLVYVVDSTVVQEYSQGHSKRFAECAAPNYGAIEGVAVDKHGNVFVSTAVGVVYEYLHGLIVSYCTARQLPIAFQFAAGIAFDRQGNLVVADAYAGAVDIIAPPYTSITSTLGSGWSVPWSVTIDRAGSQAYVSDLGTNTFSVLTYPGGSTVTTLGAVTAFSAVDSKNYVP